MRTFQKPEPGQPTLITIGARILHLRFPLGVLKELDAKHQINALKATTYQEVMESPEKFALMLYYGLKTEQTDITQQWIDDNVDASMRIDLTPYLLYAYFGRWPDKRSLARLAGDDEETPENPIPEPEPDEEPISIGSPSGPLRATTSVFQNAKSGA